MKTKPITLILTLFFCLSGSVYGEEKKESKRNPVSFYKLISLIDEFDKSNDNMYSIYKQLQKKTDKFDFLRYKHIWEFNQQVRDKIEANNTIFKYELMFIGEKIYNKNILIKHSKIRDDNLKKLMSFVQQSIKITKQMQIDIQNTTAVVSLNNHVNILNQYIDLILKYNAEPNFKIK